MTLFVLNGPELDRLGEREPEIYGTTTLDELEQMCLRESSLHGLDLDFRQTDDEDEMLAWLTEPQAADGVVINPAIFTHRSERLGPAVGQLSCPVVEVHISNIYAREDWRRKSVVSEHATGVIAGLGVRGYLLAIQAIAMIRKES